LHDFSLAIWLELNSNISIVPSDGSIPLRRALSWNSLFNAALTIERKQKPCQQYNHLTRLSFLSIGGFRVQDSGFKGSWFVRFRGSGSKITVSTGTEAKLPYSNILLKL